MVALLKKYNGKFFFTSALLLAGAIVALIIYFDLREGGAAAEERTRKAMKVLVKNQLETIRAISTLRTIKNDISYEPDTVSMKKFLEEK